MHKTSTQWSRRRQLRQEPLSCNSLQMVVRRPKELNDDTLVTESFDGGSKCPTGKPRIICKASGKAFRTRRYISLAGRLKQKRLLASLAQGCCVNSGQQSVTDMELVVQQHVKTEPKTIQSAVSKQASTLPSVG